MTNADTNITAEQVTNIICTTLAEEISNFSSTVSAENNNNQTSIGSCVNVSIEKSETMAYVSVDIVQDQQTRQNILASVTNQVIQTIKQKTGGSLLPNKSEADVSTAINNMLQTSLTSEVLDVNSSSTESGNNSNQRCVSKPSGNVQVVNNVFYGNSEAVSEELYDVYASNSAVQQVSADISNYTQTESTQKSKTGILKTLIIGAVAIMGLIVLTLIIIGVIWSVGIFASGFVGKGDSGLAVMTGQISEAAAKASENIPSVIPV